jgi:hypothetical protein
MGFAVDDTIALLDRGAPDGVAYAGPGRAEQRRVLALLDERQGRRRENALLL